MLKDNSPKSDFNYNIFHQLRFLFKSKTKNVPGEVLV